MSIRYWVGSSGGNAGNPNHIDNWSATRGGAGGASVPITGDSAYIENTSDTINGAAMGAVDLALLIIRLAEGGSIGVDTPWVIAVSSGGTAVLKVEGDAPVNITAGTNGIDKIVVEGTGFSLTGGTTVNIEGGRFGHVDVGASAVVSGTISSAGLAFDIAYNATVIATAEFDRGNHRSWRDIQSPSIGAKAQLTLLESAAVATLADVYGRLITWNYGTIADIFAHAGSEVTDKGSDYPPTVTTASVMIGAAYFNDNPTLRAAGTDIGIVK